jgi:hypothetical protein
LEFKIHLNKAQNKKETYMGNGFRYYSLERKKEKVYVTPDVLRVIYVTP